MRFLGLTCMGLAVALAGCGPTGPSSLEGFGDEVGDGDGDTIGDGDGDGDGDTIGDGDGDNQCVIEGDVGSQPQFYFEDWLTPGLGDDVPNHCGGSSIGDYAVTWKAPYSSPFRVLLYTDVGSTLTVLRGDCLGSLQGCAAFEFPSTVDFDAIEGQLYTFVVDGDAESWFGLELYPLDVMQGSCPTGELWGTQDTVFGSTFGGGFDFGSVCGGGDSEDVEYLFVPPVTGIYRIDTYGSSFDTVLAVLEGECTLGTHLACNDDDNFGSLQSTLDMLLFGDKLYTIVVDGFGGDGGSYQLNVSLVDENPGICDGTEPLPPELPVFVGWPVDATTGDAYQGCGFGSFERRFSWFAPQSGTFRAIQFADGMFSTLSVLTDCEGNGSTCGGGDDSVEIVFDALAGQQLIFISEWEPFAPGDMSLFIDLLDSGGGCGEDLGDQVPTMFAGSTLGAGDDHQGSCAVNPAPEQELHWTAPAAGTYRFTLDGSSYDTLLYIRDGGCNGMELGCNDDTVTPLGLELWSTLELELAAGQTVSIFVDGYNGGGEFNLAITPI